MMSGSLALVADDVANLFRGLAAYAVFHVSDVTGQGTVDVVDARSAAEACASVPGRFARVLEWNNPAWARHLMLARTRYVKALYASRRVA